MLDKSFSFKKVIGHPWLLGEDATLKDALSAVNNS